MSHVQAWQPIFPADSPRGQTFLLRYVVKSSLSYFLLLLGLQDLAADWEINHTILFLVNQAGSVRGEFSGLFHKRRGYENWLCACFQARAT
ncbi:MAG TPA: hypothetical protein VGD98_20130 [Ktedonobacteraceae bacterium]